MTRNGGNVEYRELAIELAKHESSLRPGGADLDGTRYVVIDKLLPTMVPLVGKSGFCSLLARALTLAKRENPELLETSVTQECSIVGLPADASGAVVTLVTHVIELLVTFLGETLTLRLLRNAWPELPALQQGSGEQSKHE